MTGSATAIDINYDVPLVTQPDMMTCWAASLAMLRSFRDQASYGVDDIAGPAPHRWMQWTEIEPIATGIGLLEIPSAGLMPAGWSDLLAQHGALWIVVKAAVASQSSHAVVLTGMAGDGSADGTYMRVNNPSGARETPSFLDFAARWDLGAVAGASIFASGVAVSTPDAGDDGTEAEPSETGESAGDGGTAVQEPAAAQATQEDLDAALQAVEPEIDDSELSVIEVAEQDGETIAGDIADIVNAGVQVIKLVANSSSVTVVTDGFAHALPAGVKAEDLSGWRPNKLTLTLDSGTTPWWSIFDADWKAKILVTFMYGGGVDGVGAYVDQAHVALDEVVLPADFSFDVEAAFPATGLRMTPATVGAIQCSLTWRLRGFFGQLLAAERSKVMLLVGTGAVQDV